MRASHFILGSTFLMLGGGMASASAERMSTVSPSERSELVRLVRQDCGSCHGMRLTGGLGTPLTREALAGKPVDYLAATILNSRPGSAMPAWKSLLSENQARWIAEQLISGFPEESR